eukprot:c11408_g1_i2.p1 GENE.c11408_g1_i2~~c11408_g1_i2.p1  ORF type:complete len:104 (+),score=18.47 c11408_g1_i2:78-389(+)
MAKEDPDKYLAEANEEYARFYEHKSRALAPLKENPFVPIGALGTAVILFGGLKQFSSGNAARSQLYMRARVIAQGATVVACFAGAYWIKMKQAKEPSQDSKPK